MLVIATETEGSKKMAVKLKGKNQIKKFRRIAEKLASKISSYEGIAGIAFIGGLVRGFVDRFSDLDIIVFLNRRDEGLRRQIRSLVLSEKRHFGSDIDLEVHLLEDFKKWKWSEIDKWEFSKAKIVFDPEGEIDKLFKEKLKLPKDFWIKRVVICGEYLKWYCCPPRANMGTIAESWVERGDLMAAHYCLNYSVNLLIRMLFALNKEFLPAPKWRIPYSYSLKWLPKGYKKLITEAMSLRSFSAKDFSIRLKAVQELWQKILPKIKEETRLTPDKISKYYVDRILRLKPWTTQ